MTQIDLKELQCTGKKKHTLMKQNISLFKNFIAKKKILTKAIKLTHKNSPIKNIFYLFKQKIYLTRWQISSKSCDKQRMHSCTKTIISTHLIPLTKCNSATSCGICSAYPL